MNLSFKILSKMNIKRNIRMNSHPSLNLESILDLAFLYAKPWLLKLSSVPLTRNVEPFKDCVFIK